MNGGGAGAKQRQRDERIHGLHTNGDNHKHEQYGWSESENQALRRYISSNYMYQNVLMYM